MTTRLRRAIGAAAIWTIGSLGVYAHHSASMFETTAIWVKGAVVRFDRINPHSIAMVEERKAEGLVRRWAVEGPDAGRLNRIGIPLDFLKTGDVVTFCGFPLKQEFANRRPSRADGTEQFVHGHVLVTADGTKSMWGSYGTVSECIRTSSEPRQAWVAFLNADTRAQQVWCSEQRRTAIQSSAASRELVEGINTLLTRPCP